MSEESQKGAVGDAAAADKMETDINGARTAVGVSHPENRLGGQSIPALNLAGVELDDYDDAKQSSPDVMPLPPDQDVGESFEDLHEIGETPHHIHGRSDQFPKPAVTVPVRATEDLQGNRADRSQTAGADTEVRGL